MPPPTSGPTHALLRLTLLPGVGPIIGRRIISHFGSAQAFFDGVTSTAAGPSASARALESIHGIGDMKARAIHAAIPDSARQLDEELARAVQLGVKFLALGDAHYPPLLAEIPDAPLVLSVLGEPASLSRGYHVGIVGSRSATHYGIETTERFSAALSQAGLTIVSGGARGVDTAAHRAALRVKGCTIAVLGCGLAHRYPPENLELFDQIISSGGALVSELPLNTSPAPENFPARNRIISGLSLGVLVVEAPKQSGALITARVAAEEQGREVMAIPGRIDSKASEGCLELIKSGGAALITSPADVIHALESQARHQFEGTHAARFSQPIDEPSTPAGARADLFSSVPTRRASTEQTPSIAAASLSESQRSVLASLNEPKSIDELARDTGLAMPTIQSDVTILELRKLIAREGSKFAARAK